MIGSNGVLSTLLFDYTQLLLQSYFLLLSHYQQVILSLILTGVLSWLSLMRLTYPMHGNNDHFFLSIQIYQIHSQFSSLHIWCFYLWLQFMIWNKDDAIATLSHTIHSIFRLGLDSSLCYIHHLWIQQFWGYGECGSLKLHLSPISSLQRGILCFCHCSQNHR